MVAVVTACGRLAESGAAMPVEVSYMVDTVSSEHKAVLDLWRSYLASRPQDFKATPLWSRAEQGCAQSAAQR